jgi:hypothetical protein
MAEIAATNGWRTDPRLKEIRSRKSEIREKIKEVDKKRAEEEIRIKERIIADGKAVVEKARVRAEKVKEAEEMVPAMPKPDDGYAGVQAHMRNLLQGLTHPKYEGKFRDTKAVLLRRFFEPEDIRTREFAPESLITRQAADLNKLFYENVAKRERIERAGLGDLLIAKKAGSKQKELIDDDILATYNQAAKHTFVDRLVDGVKNRIDAQQPKDNYRLIENDRLDVGEEDLLVDWVEKHKQAQDLVKKYSEMKGKDDGKPAPVVIDGKVQVPPEEVDKNIQRLMQLAKEKKEIEEEKKEIEDSSALFYYTRDEDRENPNRLTDGTSSWINNTPLHKNDTARSNLYPIPEIVNKNKDTANDRDGKNRFGRLDYEDEDEPMHAVKDDFPFNRKQSNPGSGKAAPSPKNKFSNMDVVDYNDHYEDKEDPQPQKQSNSPSNTHKPQSPSPTSKQPTQSAGVIIPPSKSFAQHHLNPQTVENVLGDDFIEDEIEGDVDEDYKRSQANPSQQQSSLQGASYNFDQLAESRNPSSLQDYKPSRAANAPIKQALPEEDEFNGEFEQDDFGDLDDF